MGSRQWTLALAVAFAIAIISSGFIFLDGPDGQGTPVAASIAGVDGSISLAAHAPIIIDGDAQLIAVAASEGWPGSGEATSPIIIANYSINAGGAGNAVLITNTALHFVVRNCTFYNTNHVTDALNDGSAVTLYQVENARLEHCSYWNVVTGFTLASTNHTMVLSSNGTTTYDNILLDGSNYNTIANNLVNSTEDGCAGLRLENSNYNSLLDNVVVGGHSALYLGRSEGNTIDHFNSTGTADTSVAIEYSDDNLLANFTVTSPTVNSAMLLYESNRTIVRDSVLSNGWNVGLYIINGLGNEVIDVTVQGTYNTMMSTSGIRLDGAQVVIRGCLITDNLEAGIYASNSERGIVITNNHIIGNEGQGITINNCANVTIDNNTISSNTWSLTGGGIYVGYSSHVSIANNSLDGNRFYDGELYRGTAIRVTNTDNCTVVDNDCPDAYGEALEISVADRAFIARNSVGGQVSMSMWIIEATSSVLKDTDCTGATGTAVLIERAEGLLVSNITCRGSSNGILIMNSDLVTVTGCTVSGITSESQSYGIRCLWSTGTGSVNISGNTLYDNQYEDISISGGTDCVVSDNVLAHSMCGITLTGSNGALLKNNLVYDSSRGLGFYNSDDVQVMGGVYSCIDSYTGNSIVVSSSDRFTISGVTMNNSYIGLDVSESTIGIVTDCTFNDSLYAVRAGNSVSASNSFDIHLSWNDISGQTGGVYCYGAGNWIIDNNTIHGASNYGVFLSNCYGFSTFNNTFMDNRGVTGSSFPAGESQAYDNSNNNMWYYLGNSAAWGNRWSNLRSIDADGNGIVDYPYPIDGTYISDDAPLPYGPIIRPPSMPEDLSIVEHSGGIELDWSVPASLGNSTIDYYIVYRDYYGEAGAGEYSIIATNIFDTIYVDTSSLVVGTTYTYRVVAHTTDDLTGDVAEISILYDPFIPSTHAPVRIDSDADFEAQGWPGQGTLEDPYVISGLVIDGQMAGDGIFIGNVTAHFIIRDCTIYQCAHGEMYERYFVYGYAIVLFNSSNGLVMNNDLSGNNNGIKVMGDTSYFFRGEIGIPVDIVSSGNIIQGNTISYMSGDYGIYLDYAENTTIHENLFQSDAYGITSLGGGYLDIHDNTFEGCARGIYSQTSWCLIRANAFLRCTDGIMVNGVENVMISDMEIDGAGISQNGLVISNSNHIDVSNVSLFGFYSGLTVTSTYVDITGCNFSDNANFGVQMAWAQYVSITGCNISGNDCGLYVTESQQCTISGNDISGNTRWGVRIVSAQSCQITYNRFSGNGDLAVEDSSYYSDDVVYGNYFLGNGPGGVPQASGGYVTWFNTELFYGNYWSEWTTPDENGDGIVDLPYYELDLYPLAAPIIWPSALVAHPGHDYIELSWEVPLAAFDVQITGYRIYCSTTPGEESVLTDVTGLSYNHTGLVLGQNYYYRVSALYGASSEGPLSPEVSALTADGPGACSELIATPGTGMILLSWNAPLDDGGSPILGYMIYRGTAPGNEVAYFDLQWPDAMWADMGLGNGATYYYYVRAYNAVGLGGPSNEAFTSTYDVPSAPRDVELVFGDGTITVSWTEPASLGGLPLGSYLVYITPSVGAPFTVNAGTATSLVLEELTNGVVYTIRVSAWNEAGESPLTSPMTETPATVPGAPTGLATAGHNGLIVLTWNAPGSDGGSPITLYRIYRSSATQSEVLISNCLLTTFNDNTTANGVIYYYRVVAVNKAGASPYSAQVSGIAGLARAPTGLQATVDTDSVLLNWTAPILDGGFEIIDYKIYRATSSDGTYAYLGHTGSATLRYDDRNLTFGVTYYYKVSAVTAFGEGALSSSVHGQVAESAPNAPTGLVYEIVDGAAVLSWNAPQFGSAVTDYIIYRGTASGAEHYIGHTGGATLTTYVDVGYDPAITVYYYVVASNSHGQSVASNEVCIQAEPEPVLPSAPVGLQILTSDQTAQLSWAAPAIGGPFLHYNIYRGTTEGAEVLLTTTTSLVFVDHGLTNGITYYYRVSANNTAGEGVAASISGTPLTVPGAPQALTATGGVGNVTLSWSAPGDNGGTAVLVYFIYRGTAPGSFVFLTATSGTSYIDGDLADGATYYYHVKASNAVGDGAWSSTAFTTTCSAPSAPTNLAAVTGVENVTLSWTAPATNGGDAVTSYNIYLGSSTVPLATVTGTNYVVLELANETSYIFRVAAVNGVGEGAAASVTGVTAGLPGEVIGLTAEGRVEQVVLTWNAPSSNGSSPIVGYKVFEGDNTIPSALVTGLSYTVTGLEAGTLYMFRVVAYNLVGDGAGSSASALTTALPGQVRSLLATAGNGQVALSWSSPAGGDLSYIVYRGTSPDALSERAQLSALFLVDGDLQNGVTYYYAVSAVNEAGEGPRSEVSAIPGTVPAAPTTLTAAAGESNVTLSWSAPTITGGSAIVGYSVYRSIGSGPLVHLATVIDARYNDTSVVPGVEYRYRVSTLNAFGESSLTAAVGATVEVAEGSAPGAPSGVVADVQNNGVLLTWAPPADAGNSAITGYRIYRSAGAGNLELVAVVPSSSTSYLDISVVDGQAYTYWVVAENSSGQSELPAEGQAITAKLNAGQATTVAAEVPVWVMGLSAAALVVGLVAIVMVLVFRKK